jgi:hypothetical protein
MAKSRLRFGDRVRRKSIVADDSERAAPAGSLMVGCR